MEDSAELHSEEKALLETNKKRRFKTPSQVQALEDFYIEQKYPADSMKAELAEKLGLTEKQISGWFCHRRLKDRRLLTEETHATGKQDLSSGVVLDRGSGLQQDFCGSTKRGDYKLGDLREVESWRCYDEDLPPAEFHYGRRGHYGMSEMDDTSSESDSDLHEGFHPRGRDLMDIDTLQYGMPNGFIPKIGGRVGPSGYMKIKGEVENFAITAVKRQLGRCYREDGPLLGVDFDPLPPNAFESPSRNEVHERSIPITLDVRGARWPPNLKNETLPYHQPSKKKSNSGNTVLSQRPSFSTDEYSARETSIYDDIMNTSVRPKHGVQGMKPGKRHPSGRKLTNEQTENWLHNSDDMNLKAGHKRPSLESKTSSLKPRCEDSLDKEEMVLPDKITEPEELSGRRTMREHQDPVRSKLFVGDMKVSKKGRGLFRPDFVARPAFQELPQLTKQIRGSAMEMPSSFSEDETAETSSSVD